jgi:hypothetical protein
VIDSLNPDQQQNDRNATLTFQAGDRVCVDGRLPLWMVVREHANGDVDLIEKHATLWTVQRKRLTLAAHAHYAPPGIVLVPVDRTQINALMRTLDAVSRASMAASSSDTDRVHVTAHGENNTDLAHAARHLAALVDTIFRISSSKKNAPY